MRKKQLLFLLPAILVLVVVLFLLALLIKGTNVPAPTEPGQTSGSDATPSQSASTNPQPTDPQPTESQPTDPQPTDPQPTDSQPTDPQPTDPQPTDPQPTDPQPTDPQPTDPQPTDPQPTDPQPTNPQPTEPLPTDPEPTKPKPTEPEPTKPVTPPPTQAPTEPANLPVKFPYKLPNHDIVIVSINSYDGVFLEDGRTTPAEGICALLIKNNGKTDVELISVTMYRNGEPLVFIATDVPAGAYVFVQERTGAKYEKANYTDLEAMVADDGALDQSHGEIMFEENPDGSLTVVNLTDKDFSEVRLFYKFYMADEDVYVGGITYTVRILSLKAHDSVTVKPGHYQAGSSKVVMVRTYE